jgi:hypothetical protein
VSSHELKRLEIKLEAIELLLGCLVERTSDLMALTQDVLDAIAEEKTAVDSVIAAIQSGAIGSGLSDADKQLLIDDLHGNRDHLNAVLTQNVPPPAGPTLVSISPDSAPAGSPGVTLTLVGTGFTDTTVVLANGSTLAQAATVASSSQATDVLPAALLVAAGTVGISVMNPGTPASASVTFTVV